MAVAEFFAGFLGDDSPVEIRAYDGSRAGPADAPAAVVIRSPRALRRLVTAPDELGLGRAYVSGELDIEGDIFAVLALEDRLDGLRIRPAQVLEAVRIIGIKELKPLAPPPEEARLHGRRHSQRTRRGGDRAPLRRVERLLPARPRTVDDVLVRGVE